MTIPGDSAVTLMVIANDPQTLDFARADLAQEGLRLLLEEDPERSLETALREHPRIVLLDLDLPKLNGMELLQRLVDADPLMNVVIVSGSSSPESAVEAIKGGASDYFSKPLSLSALRERVNRLVQEVRRRQKILRLDYELVNAFSFEGMVGRSAAMLEVFDQIDRIASHFRTVLVTGLTGTGKELVARALHRRSPVAARPFVSCNCSAAVETLFESEFFGHVKGAFTGATGDKIGLFEYADGGTLFLDEIGDMPLTTQSKLLRVLETREVQRVGSPVSRKINVQIVAAANRDLSRLAQEGKFREDLYHRLSALEIKLPPLSERMEDVPLLVRNFLEKYSTEYGRTIVGLTRRAQSVLSRYSWPGNVRELENVLLRACTMTREKVIDVGDLPKRLQEGKLGITGREDELVSLEEIQRRHARRVLSAVGGNKLQAAGILGISRATLYRLLADDAPQEQGPATLIQGMSKT